MGVVVDDMFGGPAPAPLESAQGALRAFCGWHVAPVVEETVTLDGNGRSRLKLPSMRVLAVSSVKVDGADVTGRVRWSDLGMLEGVYFPRRFRVVEVTMRHGYEPAEVAGLLGVIHRAADRLKTDPRVRSQAVAGASASYFTSSSGGPLSHLLTADEQEACAPYMMQRGV